MTRGATRQDREARYGAGPSVAGSTARIHALLDAPEGPGFVQRLRQAKAELDALLQQVIDDETARRLDESAA